MQTFRNKAAAIAIFLTLSMAVSTLLPSTLGQVTFPPGFPVPTYAYISVGPNPIGVGQTATINFFLASPMETGERPTNMTVIQTNPDGTTKTLGPFTGDQTGGTFTTFVPDKAGNYTFQFFYGGQTLSNTTQWRLLQNLPSQSDVATLVVQESPIERSAFPFTPLPTQYWQTPVTAMNIQNWYKVAGPWLGFGTTTFASTGSYNVSSFFNPYTESVRSGHVLWTKPWAAGGVAGGDAGGTESSNYWSTSQYEPKYAPVIINGIMYSTWYTTTTGSGGHNGIVATDLYTGKTLWVINTTTVLRCGMNTNWYSINQYGVVGPFIWTTGTIPGIPNTGTMWNMWDGLTGKYVFSLVNGTSMTLGTDPNGNILGYFINNTAGTELTHPTYGQNVLVTNTGPHLSLVNFTMALGQNSGQFSLTAGGVRAMNTGLMWSVPVPTNISGVRISPALSINSITGDAVVMSGGYIHGQGVGGEVPGWLVEASMDAYSGAQLWLQNLTYPSTVSLLPFTRTTSIFGDGLIQIANDVNYKIVAYNVRTGAKVWETTLEGLNGAAPNQFDLFSLKPYVAHGVTYWTGLGGDIWALETSTGNLRWYTNTTTLVGDPGIETPYNIWPLWVFSSACQSNDVAYFTIGHEYNPPLFHGAQLLAVNATDGSLVWSELDTSVTSTSIAYGVVLSLNAYDNQVYAFAKGPSATTVAAPSVGVTTATPITITGTVMDVSAGTKQDAVAANFPNGLPCVSDESQSKWMEFVYQQQPRPNTIIGVPVTISVLDSNNNYRQIGTTTTNAMGSFGFTWTPDIPGNYAVVAAFEGSNSYYSSSAETYFHASEAFSAPSPEFPQPIDNTMTILGVGIAILIAVAIVGIILAMMLRKRP